MRRAPKRAYHRGLLKGICRVSTVRRLQEEKRAIVDRHACPDNRLGLTQSLTTLLPITLIWAALAYAETSIGLVLASILALGLFQLRAFVLMHECGHGSLFRGKDLNQAFGFVFGVITGMPQYVWSQHHHFHHSTNGNWAKYRGPLAVASVAEFAAMSTQQQRRYEQARNIWLAPLAGFMYMIANPRINWLAGMAQLLRHLVLAKMAAPGVSWRAHAATFKTRRWDSPQQFWHMTWNNLVLLSLWVLMAYAVGPLLFFTVYAISGALAGGAGLVLFTVQHNFEHSYASDDDDWCYDHAAIHGTSFLVLPPLLNWFTANIAYHHVHHLSARIPNYRLADCHAENTHLFTDVTRVTLPQLTAALRFILWDTQARRLVSVAEWKTASTRSQAAVVPA